MSKNWFLLRAFCFSLLLVVILLLKFKSPFQSYDEGFAVFAAKRIVSGDIPYKDFWTAYPPGWFYVNALVIKLFGSSLMVTRIFDTFQRFFLLLSVFLIVSKVTNRKVSYLVTLLLALFLSFAGAYSYAGFPAIGLSLWSILSWYYYAKTYHDRWLIISGILLGFGSIIRWDIGIYACLGIMIAGFLTLLDQVFADQNTTVVNIASKDWIRLIFVTLEKAIKGKLSLIYLPMIIIGLGGYILMGFWSGFNNLFQQVFYFPIIELHQLRWLPIPSLFPSDLIFFLFGWQYFYWPIFILAISFCLFVYNFFIKVKKHSTFLPEFYLALSIIIFGILLINQALNRSDFIHTFPALIFALMAAAIIVPSYIQKISPYYLKLGHNSILIILLTLFSLPALLDLRFSLIFYPPWGCLSSLANSGCVFIDKDQEKAVSFIMSYSEPDEPIFVGNEKHDQIYFNDIGFYFLSDRPSATRYHELHTGIATTLPVQLEIVRDLETQNVNWIVLMTPGDHWEPNDSSLSSGVFFLDNFIQSNYRQVAEFGNYLVLQKVK